MKYLYILLAAAIILVPPIADVLVFGFFDLGMVIRIFGLLGFSLMSLQFILAARIPFIERVFGQDRLIRVHRLSGTASWAFLLAHGILHMVQRYVWTGSLKIDLAYEAPVLGGLIGLAVLTIVAITAMFRKLLKIPYDSWKRIHRTMYFFYPLLFLHSMLLGTSFMASRFLYYFWIALFAIVLCTWLWTFVHWIRSRRNFYRLERVTELNPSVFQYAFRGNALNNRPGQFAFLTVEHGGKVHPAHPFTVSSAPHQEEVLFTIKKSGDFTSELPAIQPGSRAFIQGPFGTLTLDKIHDDAPLVFIAGGVGITPMLSMLRHMSKELCQRRIVLIWGNRGPQDLLLADEFSEIQKMLPNLKIVHVFSNCEEKQAGIEIQEKGYVNGRIIEQHAGDVLQDGAEIVLCGPPPMMNKVLADLKELSVKANRIHWEKFSL